MRARLRQDLGGWKEAESGIRQLGRGELLLKKGGVVKLIFMHLIQAFVLIEGYAVNLSIRARSRHAFSEPLASQ